MTNGHEPRRHDDAFYTAICDSSGYQVIRDGVVVKSHRLEAICYQLDECERIQASAEFAAYDIIHARFMLL